MYCAGLVSLPRNTNVSLTIEIAPAGMAALPKRSTMFASTPHIIGLTNPSGGGGVNDELILSSWDTNDVAALGIQLPTTIRPPGLVTRTISRATSNGLGANIAPKIETVRSNEAPGTPS